MLFSAKKLWLLEKEHVCVSRKNAYPKVPTTRVVMWVTEELVLEKIFASPKSET